MHCFTKGVKHKWIVQGILFQDRGHPSQANGVQNATTAVLEQVSHPRQGFLFPSLDHGFTEGAFAELPL